MVRLLQGIHRGVLVLFVLLVQALSVSAASRTHVLTFGKWSTVTWSSDSVGSSEGGRPLTLKVRPLLVDARVREFTFGPPHDVTDRLFVVRRAFRVNDSLPQESASPPHWQWQPGGWILVDRLTGHVSPLNLPEFDPFYSAASWYRDYVAYCGISDDGKIYAMVGQITRRRPVLKKLLDGASNRFGLSGPHLATKSIPRELRSRWRTQTNLCHPRPHCRLADSRGRRRRSLEIT
jgi:hypothetical protein